MVGEDDRIRAVPQEGNNRVRKRMSTGCFIRGDRNFTHEHFDLGQDALWNRLTRDGEGCGMWRMAVNNRFHVGSMFHNGEVQQDFARPLAFARDLNPFHIDGTDVIGSHKPLADHRG